MKSDARIEESIFIPHRNDRFRELHADEQLFGHAKAPQGIQQRGRDPVPVRECGVRKLCRGAVAGVLPHFAGLRRGGLVGAGQLRFDEAYQTCSRCDYTTHVELPALGHDLVHHDAQAPTCTAVGWDAYDTCSRCDYTSYVEKPALGHDLAHHDAQAPTCTAIGWDAYDTCSRCDYTTYVEKTAKGHDLVHHDAQAPTCTAVGWDAYDTCSRCDYTTCVEKAALGHTGGTATCKAKAVCTRCNQEYGELGEHKYVDRPDGDIWDRNETIDGKEYAVYGHYKVCSVCETAKIEVEDGRQKIEDDPIESSN